MNLTTDQHQDEQRVKKLAGSAIEAAMQSRWDDAIRRNNEILQLDRAKDQDKLEAYNRLGKALSETGKIKEAREAYQKALEIEPSNTIARKNVERLATLRSKAEPDKAQQVDASLFIEEMGKTGVTVLRPSNTKLLAMLSAGDEVSLAPIGSRLTIETAAGEYIADVEPKLALRLSRLMAGGNKYAAAVAGLEAGAVRIIIKETFQDPSQVGRLSFPAGKAGELVRPYTKESMIRADSDDEEDLSEETEEWEDTDAEPDTETREVSLFDAAAPDDSDDDDFDE